MTTEQKLVNAVRRMEANPESESARADVMAALADDDPAKERNRRIEHAEETIRLNRWRRAIREFVKTGDRAKLQ